MTQVFVEQPLASPGSAKYRGREILYTLGFPIGRLFEAKPVLAISAYTNYVHCTVMDNLIKAPAKQ